MSNSTRWLLFAIALGFVGKIFMGGFGWSLSANFPGNERQLEVHSAF